VTVRLSPTVVDSTLTDMLEIRTNGGDEDRPVYGNSASGEKEYDCDFDKNGVIDKMDFLTMIQNWQSHQPTMPDSRTDFDGDGACDNIDMLIFLDNWHQ
jgi:hypothetical protein